MLPTQAQIRLVKVLCPLLVVVALSAGASEPPPQATARELPVWEELRYSLKVFWVTAKSRLTLSVAEDNPDLWLLQMRSSVARNSKRMECLMESDSLRLVHRSRYSKGKKDSRVKNYHYERDRFVRERRVPGDGASEPADWPVSSRQDIPLPDAADGAVVTDSHALLLLAARFLSEDSQTTPDIIVHTDFNFYRVSFRAGAATELTLKRTLKAKPLSLKGTRTVLPVIVEAQALDGNPKSPDFTLLGLDGTVTIFFDEETGLPLAVQGRAPKIGEITLRLKGATLREQNTGTEGHAE